MYEEGRCATRDVEVIDATFTIRGIIKMHETGIISNEDHILSFDYSGRVLIELVLERNC